MISIILTAYKEPKTIGRAIEAILNNKIKEKFEILVLAPDKETLEEAGKYAKKHKQIKLIKDEGRGKPAALNLAFKKAKGSIFVLTDGDVYIGKNAIQLMLEPFTNSTIGIVSGRPISLNSAKKMLGYWSHLLTDIAHNMRVKRVKEEKMIVCSGYLYAFRKNLIKSVPEEALSEDAIISHLIYDKGYKTAYVQKAEVYVRYPTNFSDWIKQKKRSAGGYNQLNSMVRGKERMRSFGKESSGIFKVLLYPKSLKEFVWTLGLIFARTYLWIIIFVDINIRKRNLKKIWVRVESTK